MLERFFYSTLLGGIVLWIWSAFSWTALPFREHSFSEFQEPHVVASTLRDQTRGAGMYVLTDETVTADASPAAGKMPFAFVVFDPTGMGNMAGPMLKGFLVDVVAAGLITVIVAMAACRSYRRRVILVTLVCLVSGLLSDVPDAVWWHFSRHYTILDMVDRVVSGVLMGMVIARFTAPTAAREGQPSAQSA